MRVLLLLYFTAQQPAQAPAKRTVEFTGTVLMNAFYNTARTSNSDVPVFADTDAARVSGGSATLRQTRLGVFVTDPEVLGGSFSGEIDVDFFGGQTAAPGNRTLPLLRLRRAIATVEWSHLALMIGQEKSLVAVVGPCRYQDGPRWGRAYARALFGAVGLVYRVTGRTCYVTATNIAFRRDGFQS